MRPRRSPVDNYSRESLALRVGFKLTGEDVAGVLNEVVQQRGIPTSIRVDNGTEFTSKAMDQWAYWKPHDAGLQPSRQADR